MRSFFLDEDSPTRYLRSLRSLDLYDNIYELVDALTFNLRQISPSMWGIYELTYNLFKGDGIDFFEGE